MYQGIQTIKEAKSARSRPYAQNTLRDFVKELKPFTEEDFRAMIGACTNSRKRALLSILFEGGPRIRELARLRWVGVEIEDEYGGITFLDSKTKRKWYVCVTLGREYLVRWRVDYPFDPDEPWAYVFVSSRLDPDAYPALRIALETIRKRSGVSKSIHPHLFRKSKIIDMVRKGYQDSIIKEAMWGNKNTNKLETYMVLAKMYIQEEFLDRAGIKKKAQAEPVLQAHQCPRCYTVWPPTDRYYSKCGIS